MVLDISDEKDDECTFQGGRSAKLGCGVMANPAGTSNPLLLSGVNY